MEQHRDNPLLRQPTREQAAKTLSISTYYGCTTVALLTMALLTVALLTVALLTVAILTIAGCGRRLLHCGSLCGACGLLGAQSTDEEQGPRLSGIVSMR